MTISTTEALAGSAGGGLPVPAEPRRSSTITITDRDGAKVTVSTWNVCHGVSRFVASLLGAPGAKHEVGHD
jgi:hypothetical protein